MADDKPRFNTRGRQVKKKPRLKMTKTGRATPGEKTPTVGGKTGSRQKIVPGFKGLIEKRKKRIEGAIK